MKHMEKSMQVMNDTEITVVTQIQFNKILSKTNINS